MIVKMEKTIMRVRGVVIAFCRPIEFANYFDVSFKSRRPPIKTKTV